MILGEVGTGSLGEDWGEKWTLLPGEAGVYREDRPT
jgi:hypothetical protein